MVSKPEEKTNKNKVGRPQHKYDEIIAAELRLAITFGIPQACYEQYIGHDVDTLKKHYPAVFETTAEDPTLAVKWAFFKNCIGGSVPAQIFWLKTRCPEFQEKKETESTAADTILEAIAANLKDRV